MKTLASILVLGLVFAGAAMASNITEFQPGTGRHNVLPGGRDALWSEPPDLDGIVASSEQILLFGLESEIANDFYITNDITITIAKFWGGYYANDVYCGSGMTYRCHNLRLYEDVACTPARLPDQPPHYAEYLGIPCDEGTVIYCNSYGFPVFDYRAFVSVPVHGGHRYWFGAQMCDHQYSPQWGRLAAYFVTDCGSVFWGPYFGYTEWTPCLDIFGVLFDASQEFVGFVDAGIPEGARDFTDRTTSWGAIKGLYRDATR